MHEPSVHQKDPCAPVLHDWQQGDVLGQALSQPEDLIKKGEIKVTGNAVEAAQLLDLFDRYKPEKAMAIPPESFGNAG